MRPHVLLDVDGVICNFLGGTLAEMSSRGVDCEWTEETGEVWDIMQWPFRYAGPPTLFQSMRAWTPADTRATLLDIWNREGFCTNLKPYPSAVAGVLKLVEVADVTFVTSPMVTSRHWVYERSEWLKHHFGDLGKRVIHTHHKEFICGDIFIDDKPQHVRDWDRLRYPSTAALWLRPYNAKLVADLPHYHGPDEQRWLTLHTACAP